MNKNTPTAIIISAIVTTSHMIGLSSEAFHSFLAPYVAPAVATTIWWAGKAAIFICYVHLGWVVLFAVLRLVRWVANQLLDMMNSVDELGYRIVRQVVKWLARKSKHIGIALWKWSRKLRFLHAKENPCEEVCTKARANRCVKTNCPLRPA